MESQLGVVFDFTYKDLIQAASEGCALCKCLEAENPLVRPADIREQDFLALCMKTEQLPQIGFDVYSIHDFAWYNTARPPSLGYAGDGSKGFKVYTTSGKS
jgi:hypothetical protein